MTMLEERVAQPAATFSVTGGLAAQFIADGQMIPWSGTLVVEGGDTGDKRSIEMGALTHRPLPMPFMVQLENPVGGDGHDGATLTGRIDTIERLDDGRWWGTGFIDPTSGDVGGVPVGTQLALALDKQMIRGVSVDLDQVSITEMRTKDGPKQIITAGRIIGATATPFQAFVECEIALDVDRMALAASAGSDWAEWESEIEGHLAQVWTPTDAFETLVAFAGAIPVDPPLAWFARRKFTEFTPLTVLPTGQVYGHIAGKGTCHIGFSGKCEPLPSSHTNYAKFRNASVLTAEGTMVRTGPIVMDTVHPDLRWKASDAQSFYADTGAAVCDVVPYDDEFGMAVVGAMRPDVAPARIRAFRGSDISPDWRNIDGYRRECCALLAVNNSGFKLPQTLTASAGMFIEPGDTAIALDADDDVYALVASGPMRTEPCCAACAGHDELAADADTTVDSSAREIRIGALRERFSVDTFADTEAAVERDSELDDEKAMRRAAVRARFAASCPPDKKKKPRYFRVASGTTVTDVVAEFTGTSDGARKAWESRGRGMLPSKSLADRQKEYQAANPAKPDPGADKSVADTIAETIRQVDAAKAAGKGPPAEIAAVIANSNKAADRHKMPTQAELDAWEKTQKGKGPNPFEEEQARAARGEPEPPSLFKPWDKNSKGEINSMLAHGTITEKKAAAAIITLGRDLNPPGWKTKYAPHGVELTSGDYTVRVMPSGEMSGGIEVSTLVPKGAMKLPPFVATPANLAHQVKARLELVEQHAKAKAKKFRVASPKAEAAAAAEFAGALQAWLDSRPAARAFRAASTEFAGNSEGARKAWESRKKNSGSPKPAGKPSQPAAPKLVAKIGKVGTSNHVGDALLHAKVPYSQAAAIAQVVGGNYKAAEHINIPDDAIGDALMIGGYKHSEAIAVIDALKAARTKIDSKAHVKTIKAAAAAPAKTEPTLDKAHVESLFAKPAEPKPAAKPEPAKAIGAHYTADTEPRTASGHKVDLSKAINQPIRADDEGDYTTDHMWGSYETDDHTHKIVAAHVLMPANNAKGWTNAKVTQGVMWKESSYSQKPDHAQRVWRNRAAISAALAASPQLAKQAATSKILNADRITVKFNDDGTMDIGNFDYSSRGPHATGVPAVK